MDTHACVIHPLLPKSDDSIRTPEAQLEEAKGLALAISHLELAAAEIINVHTPKPATLFGTGKMEELAAWVQGVDGNLVIINTSLSPVQQRNLEKALKTKVIDRTALILEIFGERARTHEGKLQVELAALNYQKSRLVRSWTHLERQRGGLGFVGGPGESQIELDRRIIRDRISAIKKQLDKVVRTRDLQRKTRRDTPFPLVALVGYTNAGKSTLFNRLTEAEVQAEDLLFATLDPTIRNIELPSGQTAMLSDTVGFISNLPTDLIAAFRATLEEVREADVILHIRDISHPDTAAQKEDVLQIIHDLLGKENDTPILEVANKIDLLPEADVNSENYNQLRVSAVTGAGIEQLLESVEATLFERIWADTSYALPYTEGKALAWLHSHGNVTQIEREESSMKVQVKLSKTNQERFRHQFDLSPIAAPL